MAPRLHLGCGPNSLPGWLNTDLEPGPGAAFIDVTEALPFADQTFTHIFSEHLIEHVDRAAGASLLRECRRVLRPGGALRIATPDLRFLARLSSGALNERERRYVQWAGETFLGDAAATPAMVVNNFFHAWGHRFIYDEETLRASLATAGFTSIRRQAVGESDDPVLSNLEAHGRSIPPGFNELETMVLEAVTPGL